MVDLNLQIPDSFYDEEIRCGFTVTKERKELWAVLLDLVNEFDRVCREHGLQYFADGGTALGSMRKSSVRRNSSKKKRRKLKTAR